MRFRDPAERHLAASLSVLPAPAPPATPRTPWPAIVLGLVALLAAAGAIWVLAGG